MRPRAAAGLLLLVVTAHAFVAGATHFHHRAFSGAAQDAHAAVQGSGGEGQSVPLATDETRCLLCRLQRSFVCDLQNSTVSVKPPTADALGFNSLRKVSARAARTLLPPGRAPPSV